MTATEREIARARTQSLSLVLALLLAGCGGGNSGPGGTADAANTPAPKDSGVTTDALADSQPVAVNPDTGTDSQPVTGPPALPDDPTGITKLADCALAQSGACVKPLTRSKQEVCDRWAADRPVKAQSVWVAPATTCDPGQTPLPAQEDALRRLNLVRWLSGLAPVSLDATWSSDASACAIVQVYMVVDTGDISHYPPTTARCYTDQGGTASAKSQLAAGCSTPADCMDNLFWDYGDRNLHIDGHRRGLLTPDLGTVGIGFSAPDVGSAACVRTIGDNTVVWPSGLAALVTYPSFGHVPYELVIRETYEYMPTTPLEWSIAVQPSTDFGTPKLRLYRQAELSYESVVVDFGKNPDTRFGGLWLTPGPDPLPPGTYVVLVEGTSLPAFGYRMVLEWCGPELPSTCDVWKQDCGVAGYGCYDIEPSKCRPAGTVAVGQDCKINGRGECVPGADCRPKFDGTGTWSCQAYCDLVSTTAANACAKLCPGTFALIASSVTMDMIGGFCPPP